MTLWIALLDSSIITSRIRPLADNYIYLYIMTSVAHHHHPHETKFRYDDSLLSSCASSPLAVLLAAARGPLLEDGDDPAIPALEEEEDRNDDAGGAGEEDCRTLFEMHASHYRRPPPSSGEVEFWRHQRGGDDDEVAKGKEGKEEEEGRMMSPRIEAFLRSVIFVHRHNNKKNDDDDDDYDDDGGSGRQHRVALNRFSDVPSRELPLMSASDGGGGDYFGPPSRTALDAAILPSAMTPEEQRVDGPTFVSLDNDGAISKFAETLGRRMQDERGPSRSDRDVRGGGGASSYVIDEIRDMLDSWWGGADPHFARGRRSTTRSSSSSSSFFLDKENELNGLEEEDGTNGNHHDGDWDRHLNWATEDNPDGVRIVHDAMDQGYCGSCWAVSATGTIEGETRGREGGRESSFLAGSLVLTRDMCDFVLFSPPPPPTRYT